MNAFKRLTSSPTLIVIMIFGMISLLGDLVYEGARSANSQYFTTLGITAAQIGLVFGIGEFFGYALRLLAGVASDRTGQHWRFMFLGYGLLIAVPLMGWAQNWNLLVILVLMERLGKALRSPAKDTVLSGVAAGEKDRIGVGMAFGIQEAMDQLGAFGGPLIFTLVFFFSGSDSNLAYALGYRLLLIPFLALLAFLIFAYRKVSSANLLPEPSSVGYHSQKLPQIFWLYTAFTFFAALGFVNFSLIGYHLKASGLLEDGQITLLYASAMAVDALAALLAGHCYDHLKRRRAAKHAGLLLLALIPLLSVILPLMTLRQSPRLMVVGMLFFGMILGLHETIMRSAISDLTPFHKRGTSYGLFNAGYGLALLAGAALMGWFYDLGRLDWILGFVLASEVVALAFFMKLRSAAKI